MLVLSRHPTSVMRSVRKVSLSFRHTSSISKDDSEKLVHLMNKNNFFMNRKISLAVYYSSPTSCCR